MTTPVAAKHLENGSGITFLGPAAFIWIAGIIIFISVHLAIYILQKADSRKWQGGKRPGYLGTDTGAGA